MLWVDKNSQIQALNLIQPILPIELRYIESVTHDYKRNGTTIYMASGAVIAQCKPPNRHQEFLSFLSYLDRNVPGDLYVHLITDSSVPTPQAAS